MIVHFTYKNVIRLILISFCLILSVTTKMAFANSSDSLRFKIFLPAIELGYAGYQSDELSGGLVVKTCIEYRLKYENAAFFRLNYDNRNASYSINPELFETNVLEGGLQFSDALIGVGYRYGERKIQLFGLAQGGVSFYKVPNFSIENNEVILRNIRSHAVLSRVSLGVEYYLADNAALVFEGFQSFVIEQKDFWASGQNFWGFSIGVTTTLF